MDNNSRYLLGYEQINTTPVWTLNTTYIFLEIAFQEYFDLKQFMDVIMLSLNKQNISQQKYFLSSNKYLKVFHHFVIWYFTTRYTIHSGLIYEKRDNFGPSLEFSVVLYCFRFQFQYYSTLISRYYLTLFNTDKRIQGR